ncbi:ATP-binding protein [Thiotrichales bacterium 19S3-7]|nr:ATP-binding protein [Thiotrichales bacterium 19S3-7]MCF6802802.1 ATP-binding protein [Thiotrichales bacterium 19S3-11]
MEAIKTISSQLEAIRLKGEARKQHCDIHQIGYIYSCSECDSERREAINKHHNTVMLLSQSGIRPRFTSANFSNFKAQNANDELNLEIAKNYVQKFQLIKQQGTNLVMHGGTGTGKNYLAVCMMKELIEKFAAKVKILTAYNLIHSINETYSANNTKTERQIKNAYLEYDFLVIDEFDINRGSDSDNLQLFDVINRRYEEMLPTAIISNLDRDKLIQKVGQRVMSRLLDGSLTMKFAGNDRRQFQVIGDLL